VRISASAAQIIPKIKKINALPSLSAVRHAIANNSDNLDPPKLQGLSVICMAYEK